LCILVFGGALYALGFGVGRMGLLDEVFIYFPQREVGGTPAQHGLPYEIVSLVAEDGVRLHGWFVPGRTDVTWLWLHGNAGNIGHRLGNLAQLHNRLGVSVFLFDYRGYGRSEGAPSEQGLYRDADAALAYLRSRDDLRPDRIVYFGRSLGAAVAVDLAVRQPSHALILESSFPSVSFVARQAYPFLPPGLEKLAVRARYDAESKIADVHVPVLFLHGDEDEIVSISASRRLFDAANEPKHFFAIPGAGHNDTYVEGGDAYFMELAQFLATLGE
jgi:fermentation-respiration switch protein FrsA (DUF1100 family)